MYWLHYYTTFCFTCPLLLLPWDSMSALVLWCLTLVLWCLTLAYGVWPILLQHRPRISSFAWSWLVGCQRSWLLMVFDQQIWRILRRQEFIKVWTILLSSRFQPRSEALSWHLGFTAWFWSAESALWKFHVFSVIGMLLWLFLFWLHCTCIMCLLHHVTYCIVYPTVPYILIYHV